MKATLRSIRIAPKKAQLIAKMVRGQMVLDAISSLARTNKKGARMIQDALKSAVANAKSNENQDPSVLVIKTLVVNKAQSLRRGVPMARGRVRPMRKFFSHINITLGIEGESDEKAPEKNAKTKKSQVSASQTKSTSVKNASTKSTKVASPKKDTDTSRSGSAASKKAPAKKVTTKKASA